MMKDQHMSVLEKIAESSSNLTPNERLMIQAVIESPTAVALGTANDLAGSVGVHEATASRLARKLGYASYAAFRDALREEFIATRETATRFEKTFDGTAPDSILGNLALQEALALGQVENAISAEQINTVAERLIRADRIFIYGYGNSEVLSLMMSKRFRRFGKDVHQLDGDPRHLAEGALGMRENDVLLTFAFRRPPRSYEALMQTAREAGTETIVISGNRGAILSPQPDHLLRAPRGGDADSFQTLVVPMTVCNAIIVAAGSQNKDKSLQELERLGQLIERFD